MYLKQLCINNYGSIGELSFNAKFNENGNPFPIVLIGENGSGKTLAIANIVDALIEIKRNTFGNSMQEVNENRFFKIGNHGYIKSGQIFSRVYAEFVHNDTSLKYYDIMSRTPSEAINSGKVNSSELSNIEAFNDNGFSRKTIGQLTIKNFNDFITLYFPADRYYVPSWYNSGNYKKIAYETNTDIQKAKTNLIKIDLLANIKGWLTDIYLEKTIQKVQLPDDDNLPQELRGRLADLLLRTEMQDLVTHVYSIIKGAPAEFPNTNRKNKVVGLAGNYDISQLSEGEISLFAIALSIIKEWDIFHNKIELNQITGIVLIDEADLGLHIDYAYRALPRLMKLFPKVQFILTAHSPFLLAGLYKEFGEQLSVISMPSGLPIDSISEYCELEKAEAIINSINGTDDQLKEKKKELEMLVQNIKREQGKIYIYTEGHTDSILINKAIEKLGVGNLDLIVSAVNCAANKKGNDALCKLLESLSANQVNNNIVIGIFDRDVDQKVIDNQGNQVTLKEQEYSDLGNNTYAFILPVPHDREQEDQISIEHYFTDSEIKTSNEDGQRLFLGNEFNKAGNHKSENYHYMHIGELYKTIKIIEHTTNNFVTDKTGEGNFSLSKMRFAEAVRDERQGFDSFDFSEFNKIFDVIRKIVKEARGE